MLLTEKGKEYIRETAGRLYETERNAFSSWTEEELGMHVQLLEKYVESFRKELQKL